MITINSFNNNTVLYQCSCGVIGKCTIRPLIEKSEKVLIIKCPNCGDTDKVVLNKSNDLNVDSFYSLALVIENTLI